MISVIIPLYNKERQISKTLQTVLNQTYQDFEIVIVNDGSTDNSVDEVKKFNDPRIKLIHQENAGVSAARNRGIADAKGEFIALLDADDEWKPEYLETQMNLVSKYPECDVFATNYIFRDNNGKITPTILWNLSIEGEDGVLDNYFKVASTSHPPLWTSAVMARKTALKSIGGFLEGVRLGEDLITWAKLACKYKIAFSKTPLAIYVFASQAKRLIPVKQPNSIDIVGEEYDKLIKHYEIPFLKDTAAIWHKMRMVTFVQLQKRSEARHEFRLLKKLKKPSKKDYIWYVLSFMPISVVRCLLKLKS